MFRIAMRDTRLHWVRFLMSIVAVMLATAFVSATFSFTNMLGESIAKISDSSSAADIYVRGKLVEGSENSFGPPERDPLPVTLADELGEVDGVAVAAPSAAGQAMLLGKDGDVVSNGQAPTYATTLIEGIDDLTVLEGRLPEVSGEIALEPNAMDRGGYVVGDTAVVTLGQGAPFDATIVGSVDSGWTLMGATFVFLSEEQTLASFAPSGFVRDIAIGVEDGAEIDTVMSALGDEVDDTAEVISGDDVREESKSSVAKALGFIEIFMMVFAFIAFFVGSFLIANTFAMLVRQRQREFALLRALGASPGQVLGSLVSQAVIVGVIGSLLGIGAGILLVKAAQQYFESVGTPMEGDAALPPERLIFIIALAVIFTVVASLVPSRQAAATAPVEAMRPEDPKPERMTIVRGIVSALLLVGGLAAVWTSVQSKDAVVLGVGAALSLFGVLGLGPVIVPPVLGVLGLPFRAMRPVGTLARGNVLRTPKRTAATAAALTIGMTLISAISVLAASATASTRSIIDNQMEADYWIGSQQIMGMVPNNLADQVEELETVESVTAAYFGIVRTVDPDGEVFVAAMTEQGYDEMMTVPVIEGEAVGCATEVLIAQEMRDDDGVAVGDTITIVNPQSGEHEVTVVGVTNDKFFGAQLYGNDEFYQQIVPDDARMTLALLVNASGDVDQTRADLEELVEALPMMDVMDQDELTDQTVSQISGMMNVLYAMLGLSLVIAVLSIVNTLAMAVMERTRELGLMRAVGLGNGQLTLMIIIESVLIAIFGTLLGLVLGVGLGSAVGMVLEDRGLSVLTIPWETLGWILVGTVVVGVIAALWPAYRALKQPVLDAVSSE